MHKLTMAAFGAAVMLFSIPAQAKDLRGDAFITAMNGNTLTGKMSDGKRFKMYFLPGGAATVQQGTGQPQSGTWSLDDAGDVCLKFPEDVGESGCYHVTAEGHKVTWANKSTTGHGRLFGGVAPLDMSKSE